MELVYGQDTFLGAHLSKNGHWLMGSGTQVVAVPVCRATSSPSRCSAPPAHVNYYGACNPIFCVLHECMFLLPCLDGRFTFRMPYWVVYSVLLNQQMTSIIFWCAHRSKTLGIMFCTALFMYSRKEIMLAVHHAYCYMGLGSRVASTLPLPHLQNHSCAHSSYW